jgi:hypothetical protein
VRASLIHRYLKNPTAMSYNGYKNMRRKKHPCFLRKVIHLVVTVPLQPKWLSVLPLNSMANNLSHHDAIPIHHNHFLHQAYFSIIHSFVIFQVSCLAVRFIYQGIRLGSVTGNSVTHWVMSHFVDISISQDFRDKTSISKL